MKVADLYALLGFRVDKGSEGRAHKSIGGIKSALTGLGAYFGVRFLGKSLIGFNANVEETKNQIAGMLALTKKTDLSDELANADRLLANLQRRAAALPGTTQEYAQMLGMLTQPVLAARLSMQDLEDLTVNSVVAAKALGVQWEVAARDIDQALRGQFKSVDQLTGKILGSAGFTGEKGRARFNALSAKQRGEILKAALTQKQITQLAEAQGKSFSGRLSTLKDAAERFLGLLGKGLFDKLGKKIEQLNKWVDENREKIEKVAKTIGNVLARAFDVLGKAVAWLFDDPDRIKTVLAGIAGWLTVIAARAALAMAPMLAMASLVTGAIYLFTKLKDKIGVVGAAIATAFAVGGVVLLIAKVRQLMTAMLGLRAVAASTNVGGALAGGAAGAGRAGGLLGGAASVAGRFVAPVGAAMLVNELTGGSMSDDSPWMRRMRGENVSEIVKGTKETVPAKASSDTVTQTNNVSVTVNAKTNASAADIGKEIEHRIDNRMRHAADALLGGRR